MIDSGVWLVATKFGNKKGQAKMPGLSLKLEGGV
jgi:hypothetical protein